MIEIHSEDIFPVRDAPAQVPGRPHIATVWRWIQRGVRGVKLETALIGGKRYTSREALQRFVEATTAAADGTSPAITAAADGTSTVTTTTAAHAPVTPLARRREHERACRELDEAGI